MMRLRWMIGHAAAVGGLLMTGQALAGPLSPPAGPVTSTGPTVIESLPHTISEPGKYMLTGNLTGSAGQNGVIIASSDVTLDLNGFSLIGVAGSLDGIRNSGSGLSGIEVRNGAVRDWGNDGIDLSGVENSIIRDIRANKNTLDGIRLRSGVIEGCVASDNFSDGIVCTQNVSIRGCTAEGNSFIGINAGINSVVSDSTALLNGSTGILASSASGVSNCSAQQNGGDGFDIGFGSSITNSGARGNDGNGIESSDGGSIIGCSVDSNDLHGIRVNVNALVLNNNCAKNGAGTGVVDGAGIYANSSDNRIEGNNCVDNDRGITVVIGGCFIIKNSASGNGLNYSIVAGSNVVGPIISGAGTITSTNPWANFSY